MSIAIHNLNLKFSDIHVLKNINLTIGRGEFIQLIGSNGSGKSSLIKCICQEYTNYTGEINFDNTDLKKSKSIFTDIAVLNQNINSMLFNELSIEENYQLYTEEKDAKQFISQLQEFNLRLSMIHNLAQVKVATLSGGQKQVLALLLVLARKPKLILLDEHTSALDKNASFQLMETSYKIIKNSGISTIMITHDLDIATLYGDKIIVLRNGEIVKEIIPSLVDKIDKHILLEYF